MTALFLTCWLLPSEALRRGGGQGLVVSMLGYASAPLLDGCPAASWVGDLMEPH